MSEEKQQSTPQLGSILFGVLFGVLIGAMLVGILIPISMDLHDVLVAAPMRKLQRDLEYRNDDDVSRLRNDVVSLRQEINRLGNHIRDAQIESRSNDKAIDNLRSNVINHDNNIDRIFKRLEQLNKDKEWEPEPPEPKDDVPEQPPKPL